jgi:hypothetical protein
VAPEGSWPCHKSLPLVPILNQPSPVRNCSNYFSKTILTVSSYLRLGFPSGLLPSGFSTEILYAFRISAIRVTRLAHLMLRDLMTPIIFCVIGRPSPRPCVTFRNKFIFFFFHGEESLAPAQSSNWRTTPCRPLVATYYFLSFSATSRSRFLYLQSDDAPCCVVRDPRMWHLFLQMTVTFCLEKKGFKYVLVRYRSKI